ncbi:50S ribosomal protein L22 [bacterium]|nr:50S ribosomal protein L22 [bacterium]MBT4649525.1 50S ribosomal protein L22 [bacterium]
MEARAKLRHVRVSPKKARLVASAIRGLSVSEALLRLPVINKASSPIVEKLLKSAVANATDLYEVKAEDLIIKSIMVNKSLDLKRWRPAAFGRAHPFRKHSSHIDIVVQVKEGVKVAKKDKKQKVETVKLSEIEKSAKDDPSADAQGKDKSKKLFGRKTNKEDKKTGTDANTQQASKNIRKTTNK